MPHTAPAPTSRTPAARQRARRIRAVRVSLLLLIAVGLVTSLALGTVILSPSGLWEVLLGRGSASAQKLVWEWRLPRALLAIVAGVALGVSGAIFQSLTRNPLGSPDVIGFDTGAYTGALLAMLVFGATGFVAIASGALIGGLAAAALVTVLAYRRGLQGFRFIIMGIGLAALLTALNNTILIGTGTQQARAATAWGFGSFSGLGFEQLVPLAIAVAVLIPLTALLVPGFRQLELGDDAAQALGVPIERTRLLMTAVGVALTAVVTAVAGPIAFVALVAPQINARLSGRFGLDLPGAALSGAVLLLTADIIGQRLQTSVGLITVVVGGGYFLWLLIRERRK
ncbi:iron-enterobactin ABC transporter permease [Mycetocola tolaasinivorans]|uniref:Iron-enterobactin ABC transporter permease n=2 Tax=Mycetocola tolaasinivorans TaxID=76635 RepID=A0A3L7ACJ7_9MICO|nr:iron-enterobactin ABC transporter permease [Mycetocola tolaasinivorans]